MTKPAATAPKSSSPPASLIGKVLSDRYRIEAILGEGGMGAVYLAEHVLMHKHLAIKVLHQEMTRMPEVVARFEREAMAAAHIDHPNVAAATDFGKLADGSFFLVLEYIEGTNLRDVIAEGPVPSARVLHISYQIASALARAHAIGIVHRDLKPENVMLVVRDGEPDFVKVLDFGIAKVPVGELARSEGSESAPTGSNQTLTQLGMVYGTPEYMAPEQALGQQVDARADLYALGVIMFEMLTGVRPFDSESKVALLGMKVTRDPPKPSAKNPDVRVPQGVEAVVMRLLEKEANQRFADARGLLDALERADIEEARTEPPPAAGRARPLGTPLLRTGRDSSALLSPEDGSTDDKASHPAFVWMDRWTRSVSKVWTAARTLATRLPESVRTLVPVVRGWPGSRIALVLGMPVVIFLGVILALSPRRPTAPSPAIDGGVAVPSEQPFLRRLLPPPTASPDVLAAAVASGPSAVEELTAKYPQDPAVWRAAVKARSSQKHPVEAMEAVSKLVGFGEKAADDEDVRDAILSALQGEKDGADAALALLEGSLGAVGADWLYDFSNQRLNNPKLSARLKQSISKADVRSHASPGLQVVLELRAAKGCEAKKALLPKVKEQGDRRAVVLLRPLFESKGCGFLGLGDCWSCMRRDGSLASTLAAVEQR